LRRVAREVAEVWRIISRDGYRPSESRHAPEADSAEENGWFTLSFHFNNKPVRRPHIGIFRAFLVSLAFVTDGDIA
jgi:hypothetical protein